MKIAVWHNLPSGGGKRALFDHVAGLVKRGHTVEAWCPPNPDSRYLPLGELVREHVVDMAWPAPRRLTDKLQLTLEAPRLTAALDAHCRTCAAQMDAGGFDVLFANSCMLVRAGPIGRFSRLPSVLYLQEPYRWLYEALPRLPWVAPRTPPTLQGAKDWFLGWRSLRNARLQGRAELENAAAYGRILVNSYFSRESVLRAYGLDSEVCYLGIDTARFAVPHPPRRDVVVGLGAITPEKNLRLCIEAVACTAAPHPDLVWIGNVAAESYLREMQALAAARGVTLTPRVRIPDDEVLATLGSALALVYAPRLEPFGLAPLEANACGVPVVAVAEGGVRETVADGVNGLVVGGTAEAMGAAIQRLRDSPDLARRLGEAGRQAVDERWGLEHAIDRLERQLEARLRAGP